MPQRIDQFYGLGVTVSSSIDADQYLHLKEDLEEAAKKINPPDFHGYGIYVSRIEFSVANGPIFGVRPLSNRLDHAELMLEINRKEREKRRMFFLNRSIDQTIWNLSPQIAVTPGEFTIDARLPGKYCEEHQLFEVLVFTCIADDLPQKSRKISVKTKVHPTPLFGRKFYGTDGAMTTIVSHRLTSNIQLRLPL
jgi:hypothetical protein